jgi:hypothetical protein
MQRIGMIRHSRQQRTIDPVRLAQAAGEMMIEPGLEKLLRWA